MKIRPRHFLELILIYFFFTALFLAGGKILLQYHFNLSVLWVGNSLLFLISVLSLFLHQRGAVHQRAAVFFRSVYLSMILRMFGVLLAVLIYAMIAGSGVNPPSVLACALFYFVYTFYEIFIVLRLLKKTGNGKVGSSY